MGTEIIVAGFATLVLSGVLTGVMRNLALTHGLMDVPNERSSHARPTPRGGGVAVALAATIALIFLFLLGALEPDLLLALTGGGIVVAIVGFLDDRHQLPARFRLAVHLAAALWALACLGGLPPLLNIGEHVESLGWAGYLLGAAGIVWTLNLFNFMDGIDGIAAAEAAFVACAGAVLAVMGNAGSGVSAAAFVVAAASLGFLVWNWPPAKIFMGDVGSGYLGYVIAVLAIAAAHDDPAGFFVWLILGGAFFVDASVTLVRRLARRDRVYEAHRTHAYQWLSRRWDSHLRVTLSVMAVNIFWLLPLAWYAREHPGQAVWIAALALFPLIVVAIIAGSGRPELRKDSNISAGP